MPVQEELRPGTPYVACESIESSMDFVIPVVYAPGRVMRHKHIHPGKRSRQLFGFLLLIQKITPWFVLPGALKTGIWFLLIHSPQHRLQFNVVQLKEVISFDRLVEAARQRGFDIFDHIFLQNIIIGLSIQKNRMK
jgi:hypothetical protein